MSIRARAGSRLLSAVLAVVVAGLTACGSSVSDPGSARCNAPHVTFGPKVVLAGHSEIGVHFRCAGAVLAGTLFLPDRAGPFPAVVYVHGSGEAARWRWEVPWVAMMVHAVRKRTEIDGARIGFLGTSQAGWVVPLAVVRSLHRVAFTALADAPAVTTGEEQQWSQLAGEDAASPPPLTPEKKAEITRQLQPSGFDPVSLLKQMTVPGIWVYGRQDRSQPAEKSAATLERLRTTEGKDFTVVLFPQAGHGLLDNPPSDRRAMPALLAWIQKQVRTT